MKGVTLPTETVFVMEASPIKFGLGAMDEIAYDARRLGLKRVLIVTDRHIGELGLPVRLSDVGIVPEQFSSIANIAMTVEEFERAALFYDRTLMLEPHAVDALLGKARAQTYIGQSVEAIATLDRLGLRWIATPAFVPSESLFDRWLIDHYDLAWDNGEFGLWQRRAP